MAMSAKAAHKKDLSSKPVTMTHQHFRFVAAVLRAQMTIAPITTQPVVMHFADALRSTNPNFDRARFLAACGVSE
jgi:hypothetical protein